MVCTRWTPLGDTPGTAFVISSTSSDQGLSPLAPYLTFHHSAEIAKVGSPGSWKVEAMLAEILDPPEDLAPSAASMERRTAREKQARRQCKQELPVFEQIIRVPRPLTGPTEGN
jgi:hypothetical protein